MLPNVSVAQAVAARVPSLSVDIDSAFDQAPVVPSATVAPATAGVPDELSSTLTSTVAPGSAVPLKTTVGAAWLALPLHASVGAAGATVSFVAAAAADATERFPARSSWVADALIGPSARPVASTTVSQLPSADTGAEATESCAGLPSLSVTL